MKLRIRIYLIAVTAGLLALTIASCRSAEKQACPHGELGPRWQWCVVVEGGQ